MDVEVTAAEQILVLHLPLCFGLVGSNCWHCANRIPRFRSVSQVCKVPKVNQVKQESQGRKDHEDSLDTPGRRGKRAKVPSSTALPSAWG